VVDNKRIQREKKTVEMMLKIYCQKNIILKLTFARIVRHLKIMHINDLTAVNLEKINRLVVNALYIAISRLNVRKLSR